MSNLHKASLLLGGILLLSVFPKQVFAGSGGSSCESALDDDDSDYDDDDSDYDFGSEDDSDDDSDATPACIQTTSTVGRAECRRFGQGWDRSHEPRVRVGLGIILSSVSLDQVDLSGTATHGKRYKYRYQPLMSGRKQRASLIGGSFGVDFLIRNAHLGFKMGLGGGGVEGAAQVNKEGLRMRPTFALQIQGTVVGGYATRFGKWGVLGELQVGAQSTMVTMETRVADCVSTSMSTRGRPVAKTRLVLQRWLSPWLTADLGMGSDIFQEGNIQLGLSLTGHSRSYDGNYAP